MDQFVTGTTGSMEELKQGWGHEIQYEVHRNSVPQGQSLSQLRSSALHKVKWPLRIQNK